MNERIKKYAELLLKAVKVEDKKYLFIEIPDYLSDFTELLLEAAKSYDLREVYVEKVDVFKRHELLTTLDQENINKHPVFDKKIYNKYAKLDAAFLFIKSLIPNLMDDVDVNVIKNTNEHMRSTQKYFRDLYESEKLNWCIAAVPNEHWAKDGLNISLEDFWTKILDICLVDGDDPYQNWLDKLANMEKRCKILNDYNFDYLEYQNDLGTDLKIYLPKDHIWCSGRGIHGEICNMPTEEIFTSPQYDKTEGIVYSTKPLFYNGVMIEDFSLEFKEGKVVKMEAKKGQELLESILSIDDYSCYLGECALVSYDSPINNTNLIFKETLYDENASCHLAIGMGFGECNKNAADLRGDDLRNVGINDSNTHVDFMVGDKTLSVTGVKDGKKVPIIKNGNLVI